jgi:tetratricopeptide (TPR) repeat protein
MSKRSSSSATPGSPNAREQALGRAIFALRMQNLDEAARIAAEVLKADRGSARAAQILAQALLAQNRAAEAIAPLERVARRSEDPMVEMLLATALAAVGRREEALDRASQATARRPPCIPAFIEHGGQLARIGRFEEAIAVLEGGLALMPDAIDLQRELAALHLKRNDRTRARAILLRALATAPQRPDLLTGLANVLLLSGEYAGAADAFRRVMLLRPDDAIARAEYGRCLLELGEREAGETNIVAATRENPSLLGRSIMSLAVSSRGRFFLRPSAAAKFLRGG